MDYDEMIRRNIRAARARLGLSQARASERMMNLGFRNWTSQVVGNIEQGRRELNAFEVLGIALSLETTTAELMDAKPIEQAVELVADGDLIGAVSIYNSVRGISDGAVTWHDDVPSITRPATPYSAGAWQRA